MALPSNVDGNTITLQFEDHHSIRCAIVGLSDAGIEIGNIFEQIEVDGKTMWIPSSVDSMFLTINEDSILNGGDDNA